MLLIVKFIRSAINFAIQDFTKTKNLSDCVIHAISAEMAKIIVFSLMIVFSTNAMAKTNCHLLLTNSSQNAADDNQIKFIDGWREAQGGDLVDKDIKPPTGNKIIERWNSWKNVTDVQRDQARALELLKISPRSAAAE